jgi:protein-S-isoprenylcysteine O-methyltransferase Ste14
MSTDDPGGLANEIPDLVGFPPAYFLVPLAVGLLLQRIHPFRLLPRPLARLLGVPLLAGGLALAGWAFATMLRAKTSPDPHQPVRALVTDGPFRLTRNPIYTALAMIYLGVSTLADTAWPLLWFPATVAAVQSGVIVREERYLERRFGPSYAAYRRQVRRGV